VIRRLRDDRGALAPAMPVIFVGLFVVGGLVVDGSRELNARGEAQAYAEEAARAGASAVDLTAVDLTLQPPLAEQRVQDYCATVRASNSAVIVCRFDGVGPVSDTDQRQLVVHATVRLRIPTTLLGMVGKSSLTASGFAQARPFEGVTAPES
jgi:Flp pilus assembly protein TadG